MVGLKVRCVGVNTRGTRAAKVSNQQREAHAPYKFNVTMKSLLPSVDTYDGQNNQVRH